jgi:murein DD-endopeptidase MepM/ murein hydrolase activator NlpD
MPIIRTIKDNLALVPRQHIIIFGSLLCVLILSQLFIHPTQTRQTIALEIPAEKFRPSENRLEQKASENTWRWQEYQVKSGDSLSAIFSKMDVPATILYKVLESGEQAAQLKKIYPGHTLRFAFDENNGLNALQYIPSKLEQLNFLRREDLSFSVEPIFKQAEIRLQYRYAVINDSLFLSGAAAGVSQGMIMQLANIFSGVIDFVYDPRRGDSFDILFEEQYVDDEKIGNGNIIAASYNNQGRINTAYRYEFADGRSGYFNAKGHSMRKPFLRAPLDFTRISSGFNLQRRHPLHKKIKAHRGTDYSAPRGTPVFAAGDGRVKRAGFSRANGNYVFIQHPGNIETKYLHLHKRYVKTGQKVKQRDVIGTVGSTGYSTGPHLHYEFLVNGVHRNSRTIFNKLPSADPIPKEEKARFDEQVHYLHLVYENNQQANKSVMGIENDDE